MNYVVMDTTNKKCLAWCEMQPVWVSATQATRYSTIPLILKDLKILISEYGFNVNKLTVLQGDLIA